MFTISFNDGNMKIWAFWNSYLSTSHIVYSLLIHSYLPLSEQFFILLVTQRNFSFLFQFFKKEFNI